LRPYLLVSSDFVQTGGQDRANYALASYLARRGHEVHLVAHRASPDLLEEPTVTFHRVARPLNSGLLGEPLLDRAGRAQALRLAPRGAVVVVNGGNCRWGDVNWVHYVHAAYERTTDGGLLRGLRMRVAHTRFLALERRALARARMIVADSRRTRDDLVQLLGLPPEKVRVIYYGTDPARFRPAHAAEREALRRDLGWPHKRPVAAFVGALGDRRKGFDTVFEAWKELCKDPAWDVDLAVVGRGADLESWRARAATAGLSGRLRFMGFRTDVADILRASDVLVSPTRYEPYGLGVHEALCCGLPALVSAAAGVAEQYPPELAQLLLPDPDDAPDLARRLQTWRADPAGVGVHVARLSQRLRAYTWDDMAERIVAEVEATRVSGPAEEAADSPLLV
jgi:glycosyltransferase involved in cell wall biosynthesis